MTETHSGPPRMPGWVRWPGLALGVLAVVFVALHLLGVARGPGMHVPSDPTMTHAPGGGHQ